MRLRKFRPTPSMVVAVIALIVATTGVTWAAATLPDNSVGSAQVRDNSVRSGDIRNGNVRAADIGTNAIQGRHIGDNQIGGNEILEADLGQVPSAVAAVNAERLAGRPAADYVDIDEERTFRVALRFGEKREIVTNGDIGIEAQCRENAVGDRDQLRLLGVTRAEETFLRGQDAHIGPGSNSDYLTPATLEDQRELVSYTTSGTNPDAPGVTFSIDTGLIAGPGGEWIGIDAEILLLGVRVAGSDCLAVGVANLSRP